MIARKNEAAVTSRDEELPRTLNVSPRLVDVLALLLQGWSNKLIARELALSVETVKQYVTILLGKLGVTSRAQVPMAVNRHHDALLAWDRARRERRAGTASADAAPSRTATGAPPPSSGAF
jgi:ATP/maltotriose-dependent transcriptional regulator MalT